MSSSPRRSSLDARAEAASGIMVAEDGALVLSPSGRIINASILVLL